MASGLPKGPREPRPLGGVARAVMMRATAPGCLPLTSRLWERSTPHPFWLSLWKGLRCPQPGAPTCPGRGPGEFPLRPTHVSLRTPPAHLAAGLGRVNRRPRRLRRPLHHATGRTVRSRCKFDLVLPVVVSSKTELLPWAADPQASVQRAPPSAARPSLRGPPAGVFPNLLSSPLTAESGSPPSPHISASLPSPTGASPGSPSR